MKINYNYQEVKFYFYKHYRDGLFDKTNLYQNLIRAELGNEQIEKQYEISLDWISNVPENGNDAVETPTNGENKPNIPNKNTNVNVIVNKVEKGTNIKVVGAVLSLYEGNPEDGKIIETWTRTNEAKKIKLEFWKTYTLIENSALEGYELAKPIKFISGYTKETDSIKIIENKTDYAGYRYNSERYITDGVNKNVIYCFNHDLSNPEAVLNDTLPELTNKDYPHYKQWSLNNVSDEILRENQKENFMCEQLAELLLAGYPTDYYGYKEKYKLSDSEAYARTQLALDSVLKGNRWLKSTEGLKDKYLDLANYYNDLIKSFLDPKIENSETSIDFFEWINGTGKQNKIYQNLIGVTDFENNISVEVTMEGEKKIDIPGIGGTTPELPGEEGTTQNKPNLNISKTGNLGTIGFGILGALSLIGLGILNKSKFK